MQYGYGATDFVVGSRSYAAASDRGRSDALEQICGPAQ